MAPWQPAEVQRHHGECILYTTSAKANVEPGLILNCLRTDSLFVLKKSQRPNAYRLIWLVRCVKVGQPTPWLLTPTWAEYCRRTLCAGERLVDIGDVRGESLHDWISCSLEEAHITEKTMIQSLLTKQNNKKNMALWMLVMISVRKNYFSRRTLGLGGFPNLDTVLD